MRLSSWHMGLRVGFLLSVAVSAAVGTGTLNLSAETPSGCPSSRLAQRAATAAETLLAVGRAQGTGDG